MNTAVRNRTTYRATRILFGLFFIAVTTRAIAAPLALDLAAIHQPGWIRLTGSRAHSTLYIPINPGTQPTALVLHLMPSPLLVRGQLRVTVHRQVIAAEALPHHRQTWQIPLTDLQDHGAMLPLTIRIVTANHNVCSFRNGNWLQINPSTQVLFAQTSMGSPTIANYLPPLLKKLAIIVTNPRQDQNTQAALDIAAYVAHHYASKPPVITVSALPSHLDRRNPHYSRIIVIGGGTTGIITTPKTWGLPQYALRVGGHNPARTAATLFVASQPFVPAPVGNVRQVFTNVQTEQNITGVRTTFATLGYPAEQIVTARPGAAHILYHFSQTDLGGPIRTLRIHMGGVNTPLESTAHAYLSLRMNGILFYSQPIASTKFNFYTTVPRSLLRRDNTLAADFQYTPPAGRCDVGALPFAATINNASYFIFHRGNSLPGGFDRFPQEWAGGFSVYIQKNNIANMQQALDLVEAIQHTARLSLKPHLVNHYHESGPLLAIGNTAPDGAPLQLTPFDLKNGSGQVVLRYSTTGLYAAMEAYKRRIILAGPTALRAKLLRGALHTNGWFNLKGDTVLQGQTGTVLMARLNGKGYHVVPLTPTPATWWERYRLWAYIILLAFIIGVLAWIYPRVVRRGGPKAG